MALNPQGVPRGESKVFELHLLSRSTFHKKPSSQPSSSSAHPPPPSSGRPPSGSVNCFVPFNMRRPGSKEFIAVGCDEGLWIGLRGNEKSFQRVMVVKYVQQLEFLEEAEMLLLLADSILYQYPISTLLAPSAPLPRAVPSPPPTLASRSSSPSLRPQYQAASSSSPQPRPRSRSPASARSSADDFRGPLKLSGQAKIIFFAVGTLQGKTLLIYAKKKGLNDSVFRCLELTVPGVDEKKSEKVESWRMYKEFFIPSEAHFIKFLRSKIAIGCGKGVEILDLATLQGGTIPVLPAVAPGVAALASTFGLSNIKNGNGSDASATQAELSLAQLARKCEGAVPLAVGRVEQGDREGDFLVVYETFGLHLSSKGGHPTPPLVPIPWTTHSTSASFHPPNHLVLISSNFIEVRNVATGELVQMMSGKNVRRVWEERGEWKEIEGLPAYNAAPGASGVEGELRRGRVGVVMDEVGGERGALGQVLYELVPVLPELLVPTSPPPSIGRGAYPPSPLTVALGRTRSLALRERERDLGDGDAHRGDYFHAV